MHIKNPKMSLLMFFFMLLGACFSLTPKLYAQVKFDSNMLGGLEARSIGPAVMSGRVMAIAGVNNDPSTVYIGAASGGVWKTTNGGATFKPIFDKYTQSIGAIAIDQSTPNTVWVATGEACTRNSVSVGTGIYKSTDGGENWQLMGLEKSERISKIIIDPKTPNTVYVAVVGALWSSSEDRGLYKTTDGGKTWSKILYVDENTGCSDIAIDPQEPNRIYAGMWQFRRQPWSFSSGGNGSGLHRSTDSGKTWTKVTKGMPEGILGRIAVAVAPSRPNVIYANIESKKTALYRSEDLGESWTMMNAVDFNVTVRPFYFSHLIVDPKDYKKVFKLGVFVSITRDGGSSFTGSNGFHSDVHALWIDPNNTSRMFLGTDGGAYLSNDQGGSWHHMRNLPLSQFYHITYDQEIPYNVYGGLQDNNCWYGPSDSYSGAITNSDWQVSSGGDGFNTFVDATDKNIIYSQYQGGNIQRYNKNTRDVKAIKPYAKEGEPKYRFNWNAGFAQSQKNPNVIYVGAQFLFRSTDKGESWQKISDDLTTNDSKKQQQDDSGGLSTDNSSAENHCTIYSIKDSKLDENIIWVGTDDGNVQVSRDGGKSWTNVVSNIPNLPANTWCSSVEPSYKDPATAYATFTGHQTGDFKSYVYKTTDFGKTWQSLVTDSIKGYARVIREDVISPNLLFVGTEFGLFISIDGGKQWSQFTSGKFPISVPVYDLAIHPRESDLIIATHGRGVFILDDISPLRQLSKENLEKAAVIFETRPSQTKFFTISSASSGLQDEFYGAALDDAVYITYYLKERHVFGDFKVEIYNAEGKLMTTLPGTKRRGLNRITWVPRLKPPKVSASETIAAGALTGPTAPEGTYTVKIIKGDQTVTGSVKLVNDPRLPYSAADRKLQEESVLKLYRLQERLAFITSTITNARDQAKDRAKKLKENDPLVKSLEGFASQIDKIHETLVATKADSFYGIKGEEKLRERIVDLYSTIAGYGGRPTISQLERVQSLTNDVEKGNKDFEAIVGKELEGLNSKLGTKKVDPIKLLTQEEYDKKAEKEGPATTQYPERGVFPRMY